jgi:hypothetical protein
MLNGKLDFNQKAIGRPMLIFAAVHSSGSTAAVHSERQKRC